MKRIILATSVFLAFFVAGFSHAQTTTAQTDASDFTLMSLDGKSVSLHDYLKKKIIVINFWAAWCDACEEEMPWLLKLKNQNASGDIVFIGINAGETERMARKFVDKTGYSYLILLDADKSVARQFQVLGLPQTLVISKDSKIVYRGGRPPEDLSFVK
jgi:peroxiredoxin